MVRAPDSEPIGPFTFEEFLEFEQESELKHELVDGFSYPWEEANPAYGLAGASRRHQRVVRNIDYVLGPAALRKGCETFGSDMLLRVSERLAYYPDLQLICDPSDDHELYSTRPCVVFEVLSRRTARVDRAEKVLAYRALPSLQAYLIVHQDRRDVERHWRDAEGEWQLASITEGSVPVPCLDIGLPLDAIYAGILED